MKTWGLLLFLCGKSFSLIAQTGPAAVSAFHFSEVDNYASNLQIRNNDLEQLCETLTGPYPAELEKARAIFVWISENIAYDCGSENRLAENPDEASHPLYYTQIQLKNILDTRRTRCEGFSFLFKLMCNLCGIYCSQLEGYARFGGERVDPATVLPNHAWNAACLDGQWYEIDPTAGSGHCESRRFRRVRNDMYFGMSEKLLERLYVPIDDARRTSNQGRINVKF